MQNRFAAKDFFYMLIGLTVCLLLFLNMLKTDREVVSLENVGAALKSQATTLGKLEAAITELGGSLRIDPGALVAPTPDDPVSSRSDVPLNIARRPSYEPGYDIRFGAMSSAVNRRGLPQQWQTAPDAELPQDFATGDTVVLSWSADSDTLTPVVATDAYARRIFWEVLEQLVHLDIDAPFSYVPGLARSWEVSDDGMELTFHLFENATWSDGRPVTADDVVQETFLQVHTSAATFDPSRRFKPWLFTIGANKARDFLRARNRKREVPLDAQVGGDEDSSGQRFVDLLSSDSATPDTDMGLDEKRRQVQEVVADMPAKLCEVLILAYYHRFSYKDIAEVMGIPLGTVKSRLHAAVADFGERYRTAREVASDSQSEANPERR